ncbi:solute carrier family 35 member E1 homolog [Bolinopsis microptera]|uniref:solute carrier family 35 member E1 homolog n=1 Tax=Bolinopsis microptera TaxID=2820187 RepID=UPI00307994BB
MSITPSPSSFNLQNLASESTKTKLEPKSPYYLIIKLLLICGFWYCSSAFSNIALKKCLTVFPFPLTLTVVQFLGCALLTFPLLKYMNVRGAFILSKGLFITGILPLSFGKVSAVFFATVSIGNVPVSYSNTIKASLPIFSVLFSRVMLGQRHSVAIYFSLLMIISGVVISSFTEVLFDLSGLVCALLSTMSTALLSVYAKKAMVDNNLHHLKMLYFVSLSSLFLCLPLWLFHDASRLLNFDYSALKDPVSEIFPYMLAVSIFNWSQNVAAFSFLSLVNPVSYSVANCMKRVFTIAMSLAILRNPVTSTNMLGMGASIGGVALYNKIKYDENKMEKLKLPISVKQTYPHSPSNGQIHPSNGIHPKLKVPVFETKTHTSSFINNNNLNTLNRRDSDFNGSFIA